MARGAGCRPAVGAAAQAARERARRALAGAQELSPMCEHPEHRPQLPLSDQQVAQQQDELAGRPARAAARRGHRRRCWAKRRGARACRPQPRRRREPAALGAARQAVPAAGREDPRFRLVPRLGRRHALSRRDGRGELQGRVEGQSRHAAGRDGAGRRPRGARRGDRPAARASGTPTWAGSSTTRTPASAASR